MGSWSSMGGPTIRLLYINPYPAQNVRGPGPQGVTKSLVSQSNGNYLQTFAVLELKDPYTAHWSKRCP